MVILIGFYLCKTHYYNFLSQRMSFFTEIFCFIGCYLVVISVLAVFFDIHCAFFQFLIAVVQSDLDQFDVEIIKLVQHVHCQTMVILIDE